MSKIPSLFRHRNSPAAALLFCAAAFALAMAFSAPAAEAPVPDTPDTLDKAETAPLSDSAITTKAPPPDLLIKPLTRKKTSATDSAADGIPAVDSFNLDSGFYIGGGVGLSIGSGQVFTLWKNGIQSHLSDFGLSDTSFLLAGGAGDTMKLVFRTQKAADVYNMMFPLSISAGRLAGGHRYSAAVSFTMLSKSSRLYVDIGDNADSTGRRLDISQSMGLYAITLDLIYGRAIPDRFFSIDGSDRTDFIAGISVSPFIGLNRTSSTGALEDSVSDPRLWALRDSVARGLYSVSASGFALGWRLGVAKMRRLSVKGGVEGRLCYCGTWTANFRTPDGTLAEKEISPKSAAPDRKVSYVSHRFEISVSLIRKL